MTDIQTLFALLADAAEPAVVAAIEQAFRSGPDAGLNRINPLAFAARHGLPEEPVISGFLHATQIGLFEMSWNVLCPGCGSVLETGASLKSINRSEYHCTLCAAGYEPTLDEMVEVTFTISPRARRIAAHDPDSLPLWDYARQIFWGSGIDLPDAMPASIDEIILDSVELPPDERAILSLQLPAQFIIILDPVTHATQLLEVKGEPTRERQAVSLILNESRVPSETIVLRPGPLRLSIENRTRRRTLPSVWIAGDALHALLGARIPFLTAKRLLSNQTFRDIYRTDILDVDQRLKILSLTFLFTDLKGSTELYERVGDLVAYDLVRSHFNILARIIAEEAGAVVKTIGDAVMATFPAPERALAAALRIREAMAPTTMPAPHADLTLKIGLHEGPCLAVTLNDRQDYFGQTVNIASRVQGLATSRSILATGPVTAGASSLAVLRQHGVTPTARSTLLRGIEKEVPVYEIP